MLVAQVECGDVGDVGITYATHITKASIGSMPKGRSHNDSPSTQDSYCSSLSATI